MAEAKILSDVSGMVWKVLVKEGDAVGEDAPVVVLESMKMEIPILSSEAGVVSEVLVQEGSRVNEGDTLLILTV